MTVCLALSFSCLSAQGFLRMEPPIQNSGGTGLPHAYIGGLDAAQFNHVDLDNDGTMDLVVFDRAGDVILPFLFNSSVPDYTYAPEYREFFPDIRHWMLTRDYNCDGIMDLFVYPYSVSVDGLQVYEGSYDINGKPQFDLKYDYLTFPNFVGFETNVYVTTIDIPDVSDVDGDGDLDILTFQLGGGYVEYYRNTAVENGVGCDTMMFVQESDCWGRFYESGISEPVDLSPDEDSCYGRVSFIPRTSLHAGSTVLSMDVNNDNKRDLLLGDLSFPNINLLINGGTNKKGWMVSQENNFPSNDTPVDLFIFPSMFSVDIDGDGVNDLVVGTNQENVSENIDNAWLYLNRGTNTAPVFELITTQLFNGQSIDVGSTSAPAFFDYNNDGLLDILIGTSGRFVTGGTSIASVTLLENIGTVTNPAFKVVDDNYLNIESLGISFTHPAVGDLDNDGDEDLLLGESGGRLVFFENVAGAGNAPNFAAAVPSYKFIDVGQNSTPFIVDLDRDGDQDLVIGERQGGLSFFSNNGGVNPNFTYTEVDTFAGVDTRNLGFPNGYSAPIFYERSGQYEMLSGSDEGSILQYTNIDGNIGITDNFLLFDNKYGLMREGERTRVAVADINNDGFLDYLVGNKRGGLTWFTENPVPLSIPMLNAEELPIAIAPNPTRDIITITTETDLQNASIELVDMSGRTLVQQQINTTITSLSLEAFPAGIYVVHIRSDEGYATKRIIKQ